MLSLVSRLASWAGCGIRLLLDSNEYRSVILLYTARYYFTPGNHRERTYLGNQPTRFIVGLTLIIIIIITLFQEENIFGTNANLTYGAHI